MKYDPDLYLIKTAHSFFVRGYRRGYLYDLQRQEGCLVPLSMCDIAERYDRKPVAELIRAFGHQREEIDSYLDFLMEKEVFFLSAHKSDIKRFTGLNLEVHERSAINDIIVDISKGAGMVLSGELSRVAVRLGIKYVQLRSAEKTSLEQIEDMLKRFDDTPVKYVEMIVPYDMEPDPKDLELLLVYYQRLGRLVFYQCPGNKTLSFLKGFSKVDYCTEPVLSPDGCGNTDIAYFSINPYLFAESQHHNTCLNRKLCIDQDGYIKNCPYLSHHYGHISTTDIAEVVKLPEFQQWWHIKKDEIDVCRDCEFRHLCTDCRALVKDPGNVYSQPAKCTYNPYICKWAGEEGYVPVEECGTYSRETGFVPDKGKIMKLNKAILGDG